MLKVHEMLTESINNETEIIIDWSGVVDGNHYDKIREYKLIGFVVFRWDKQFSRWCETAWETFDQMVKHGADVIWRKS